MKVKVIQEVESALFRRLVGLLSLLLVSGAKQAVHFHNYLIPGARRTFIVLAPDWLSLSLLLVSGAWQSIHFCSHLFYALGTFFTFTFTCSRRRKGFSLSHYLVSGARRAFTFICFRRQMSFHFYLFHAPGALFTFTPDGLQIGFYFHFHFHRCQEGSQLQLERELYPGSGCGIWTSGCFWWRIMWIFISEEVDLLLGEWSGEKKSKENLSQGAAACNENFDGECWGENNEKEKTLFQRGTACNPDNDNDKEKKTTISEGSCWQPFYQRLPWLQST